MMRTSDFMRLLLLSAIWGASFLFMRMIAPTLGALPTAFFRVLLGAVGLGLTLAALHLRWNFKEKFRATLVLGVINSGIPFLMYSMAARILPAGYSAILNATTPLMGVVLGALFFSEKLTRNRVAGVLLGFAGVALLVDTGPVTATHHVLLGAGACLIATACYGAAGFLTKRWISERGGLDSKLVAFGSQVGATLCLLPVFAYSAAINPPASWGGGELWAAIGALGLICTAFAYILYFKLIADIGPIKSLTVTFLIPPFGVLWGFLFLNEPLSWGYLFSGGLIGLAVWMVLRKNNSNNLVSAAKLTSKLAQE